jgi:hypothetical protein
LANKEPCHQNDNQLHALHTHNKEPCLPKWRKENRWIIANKELAYQNDEKENVQLN